MACLVCGTLYRAVPMVRDLARVSTRTRAPVTADVTADATAGAAAQPGEPQQDFTPEQKQSCWVRPWFGQRTHDLLSHPAAEWRAVSFQWKNPDFLLGNVDFRLKNVDVTIQKVVLQHFVLSLLDLFTLLCFALALLPPYGWHRLPRTLGKLCGRSNVSGREGKHWSNTGLVFTVHFAAQDLEGYELTIRKAEFVRFYNVIFTEFVRFDTKMMIVPLKTTILQ